MVLSEISKKVFLDRYALKNKQGEPIEKTPKQMWQRVAKAVASVEKKDQRKKWEKEFFWAMKDFKYIPGGRILAGAGSGFAVTFYNCFVIPSPKDSRDGILETLKQMVEIMARGGGVGINLSSLRPRGARVKKVNGFSSGPVNWAELFSVATKDIIQQGGSRRGALMLMLWDWHPDIEEFITIKQDPTKITGANLSVCVSDEFMEAVEKDKDWPLVFPDLDDKEYDEKWSGDLTKWQKMGKKVKVYKTVKARKIWDLIAYAAWKSGEPGVVFMERYNKLYNNWYWNRINCVNPCVTGDTLVTTDKGYKKAKDLKVGDTILTVKGWRRIKKFYNNGKKLIYRIVFANGDKLEATADHQLRIIREGRFLWVKTTDLKTTDLALKLTLVRRFDQKNQNQKSKDKKDKNCQKQMGVQLRNFHNFYNLAFLAKDKLINQMMPVITTQNTITNQSSLSTPLIKGGKIATAKTTWPASAKMSESFFNSERESCQEKNLFFINDIISGKKIFFEVELVPIKKIVNTKKYAEVFDVYEPETLTWITNNYLSLDCGEEGLPPWGVCNLGSINLSALVKGDGIDKKARFDFKTLKKLVAIAVRFQDNVVDMDPYIFPEIKKTQLEGERRIGLGTMGLADALIKLHLRYGSKESLKFIDKVYKTIRDAAYEASTQLAKEKGPFPKFNKNFYLKGEFIKQLPLPIKEKIKKYGIRNSLLLMQAPTGSTSLMAQTSSGIEPVFEFEFIRKDRLGTHIIRHHLYEKWYQKHEKEIKEGKIKKPEWFVSANELTPEDHVYVQATIQKYVDASISKTVNAPKTHTVEDVKKLYTLAYKLGCKGITYFREGSRQGVLERKTEEKKEEEKAPNYIIKPRPMVVHGSTYRINTPVGVAFITINTNGGNPPEPLEVFINVGKAGTDVYAMAEGLGRMISTALRFSSHLPVEVRVREIINQLKDIGGARSYGFGKDKIRSLPDAVAKVLAMHYKISINGNGEVNHNNKPKLVENITQPTISNLPFDEEKIFDICPSCGEAAFVHEEGCKKCYSCGYSECG